MSTKPSISFFPKVALWTLDIFCVLVVVAVLLSTGSSVLHPEAKNLESRLGTVFVQLSFALFFWLAHVLIRRTLQGNPFEPRNIKLVYTLAGMILLASTVNGLSFSYVQRTTEITTQTTTSKTGQVLKNENQDKVKAYPPKWEVNYDHKYSGFMDWAINSGVLYGLIMVGFGAIFQRGVELREGEERLRAESALTI